MEHEDTYGEKIYQWQCVSCWIMMNQTPIVLRRFGTITLSNNIKYTSIPSTEAPTFITEW
jgi:hypothetical protein